MKSWFCFQSWQIGVGFVSGFTEEIMWRLSLGSYFNVSSLLFVCFQVEKSAFYEFSCYFKYLSLPTAMCTVLQLTERLLLDHAQRLPESKVQYVEYTCCYRSVSDPWKYADSGAGGLGTVHKMLNSSCFCVQLVCRTASLAKPVYFSVFRQYHRALVAVLLSRTWHVRRQAHQTVKKLLSSLGGYKLAYGLLEELKVVLSSHKVSSQEA